VAWVDYVLEVCLDQVTFMSTLLDFAAMKSRIKACLVFEATVLKNGVGQESLNALHNLFLSGEALGRGDFKAMLGMSDRGPPMPWGRWSNAACSSLTHHKARCVLGCRSMLCAFSFHVCGQRLNPTRQISD
jgi:hypothetical protein